MFRTSVYFKRDFGTKIVFFAHFEDILSVKARILGRMRK